MVYREGEHIEPLSKRDEIIVSRKSDSGKNPETFSEPFHCLNHRDTQLSKRRETFVPVIIGLSVQRTNVIAS